MLLSLPPSLVSFIFCILDSHVVTASPEGIGYYVASGAGAIRSGSGGGSNMTTTAALVSTGSGLAYASSCNSALSSWSLASFSWQESAASKETSKYVSAVTYGSELPGTTKVTSIITLCDGYKRVVGRTYASAGSTETFTDSFTNTITMTKAPTATYSPSPCSIQPSDCAALSSAFSSSLSVSGHLSGAPPLCTVTPSSSVSYSTNANNQTCNNCQIVASTARLMYWPVTTVEGSGDLCNKSAITINPSPITTAPNSFVTEGITITSPSVAISFGYMSRADGCGTTINHTIIPVRADDVTSVRGYRALFTHHRFNFADLNYHCFNTNSTNYTIPDGKGDDCYQEVPADAYFGGLNNAAVLDQYVFRTMNMSQSTIWNDYQPQILPPDTMTADIKSIWGDNCNIHPDGVWDPPIALTPAATVKGPSNGPGATTTASSSAAATTAASPVFQYGAVGPEETSIKSLSTGRQHFTAAADEQGSSSSGSAVNAQSTWASAHAPSQGPVASTDCVTIGTDVYTRTTAANGAVVLAGHSTSLTEEGNGAGASSATTSSGAPDTTAFTQNGQALTWTRESGGLWVFSDSSATLIASNGGPAVVTDGVTVSVGSTGIVRVGTTSTGTATNSSAALATETGGAMGLYNMVGGQAMILGAGLAGLLVL